MTGEGVERAVLNELTPSKQEAERMAELVQRLESDVRRALRAAGSTAEASVQGSIAKDTWIAGSTDLDLFVLCEPDTPAEQLEALATRLGDAVFDSWDQKYAQHPYVLGQYAGVQVDLVPAYKIRDASQRASAVDRTPLHTAWVRANLSRAQRGDVRLLKQWMKGVGVYGAETAIGGFSGYLCEVLVDWHENFRGALEWLRRSQPRAHGWGDELPDQPSALLIADPVDDSRNVAAAVTEETLARAAEAAEAYLAEPRRSFFFPAAPSATQPAQLQAALKREGHGWAGLVLRPRTDRLDLVLPQFQKAARQAAEHLSRAGLTVLRHRVTVLGDQRVAMQWLCSPAELPPTFERRGPAADKQPNAAAFERKWTGHPDAQGPVRSDGGHLVVTVAHRARTPMEWLRANQQIAFVGKHVRKAMAQAAFMGDPTNAPDPWAPTVSEFILDRRPWQR